MLASTRMAGRAASTRRTQNRAALGHAQTQQDQRGRPQLGQLVPGDRAVDDPGDDQRGRSIQQMVAAIAAIAEAPSEGKAGLA